MFALMEERRVMVNVIAFMKDSWMMKIFEFQHGSLTFLPGYDLRVINWHALISSHDQSVYFQLYRSICY
jgi:hypothetical protein